MSSLGQFNLLDKDTRLIKYKESVYKIKLQYKNTKNIGDDSLPCSQENIQSEIEAAIRAVLAMSGNLRSFRTDHFLIHPERRYWNTASLLKFFEHGHELRGDPHMIYLTVEDLPDHLRKTHQTEETQTHDGGSKRKFDDNENQRAGPSSRSTKKARTPASASKSSRLRKRGKSSQQGRPNDMESTTDDANSSSDHENDEKRPKFYSPPNKHRRYALRKRSASHPHAGGEPSRGKRMLMPSRQNRFISDGVHETPSSEAREEGSQRHYQQPPLDDVPLQYAATAADQSQAAHHKCGAHTSKEAVFEVGLKVCLYMDGLDLMVKLIAVVEGKNALQSEKQVQQQLLYMS